MKFLICTDVAARGIDVSGLPYGKRSYFNQTFNLVHKYMASGRVYDLESVQYHCCSTALYLLIHIWYPLCLSAMPSHCIIFPGKCRSNGVHCCQVPHSTIRG